MIYYAVEKPSRSNPINVDRLALQAMLEHVVDGVLPFHGVDPNDLPEGLDGHLVQFGVSKDQSLEIAEEFFHKGIRAEIIGFKDGTYTLKLNYER